jgi:hypothetical protein
MLDVVLSFMLLFKLFRFVEALALSLSLSFSGTIKKGRGKSKDLISNVNVRKKNSFAHYSKSLDSYVSIRHSQNEWCIVIGTMLPPYGIWVAYAMETGIRTYDIGYLYVVQCKQSHHSFLK